jgi:phosphatidylglycerol---prolipoprotein diacylglyceryl transferase
VFTGNARISILIGAIFGALVGSRLVGVLERPYEWKAAGNMLLYLYSNKTVLGGFLGGLAGVEIIKKSMGETRASGDLFVYPILLALCIGRIGCFSMGVYEQTYGLPTTWLTGMNLGDGMLRHPVALYEIGFLTLLWIALIQTAKKHALQAGALFKLFMIAYLFFRFVLEAFKPVYYYPFGLSAIQVFGLLGLLYYAPYIIHPHKLIKTAYART